MYNDGLTAATWALNSAVECHLHTVEVIGSNPIAPTMLYVSCLCPAQSVRVARRSVLHKFDPKAGLMESLGAEGLVLRTRLLSFFTATPILPGLNYA